MTPWTYVSPALLLCLLAIAVGALRWSHVVGRGGCYIPLGGWRPS